NVARADVELPRERDDRNIDVAVLSRGALERVEKLVRGLLERVHLAGARHRTGVVERKRDAQAGVAPLDHRVGPDVHLRRAENAPEVRFYPARRGDGEL